MTTASKIYTMVYKMVIFDDNNKSIQIKRFLSNSSRVPHAKFYICKKVIFFENFDYRATLNENESWQSRDQSRSQLYSILSQHTHVFY